MYNVFKRVICKVSLSFIIIFLVSTLVSLFTDRLTPADAQTIDKSNVLYLPTINLGQDYKAIISLTNNEAKTTGVTLTAYDLTGNSLGVITSITQLEAEATKTVDAQILPPATTSLKIESNDNIIANAVLKTIDGKKSEAIPAIQDSSRQLDFPTLASDDVYFKTITLLNPNTIPASAEIIAFNKSGMEIDHYMLPALLPSENRTITVVDIFSNETLENLFTVRVISDENIIGVQLVDYPERDLVGLPALTTVSRGWTFPIATKGGDLELWTAVGILNHGNTVVSIEVEAFDSNNNSLGIIDRRVLSPKTTHFLTTANMRGTIPINATFLEVTSEQPVSGYEVIGVVNGSGIAAILGIPEEDQTIAGTEIIGSKDGSVLNAYPIVRMADGSVSSTTGKLKSVDWIEKIILKIYKSNIIQPEIASTSLTTTSVPNAPTNLTATILDNTRVVLYWHDINLNEKGFKIERKIGSGNWELRKTTGVNTASFNNNYHVDTELNTGTYTYHYRIRAYNDYGDSNNSNEAKASSIPISDGFNYPVGAVDGNGPYYYGNGQTCTSLKGGGYNWHVTSDVNDPNYVNGVKHTGEDWNGSCGGDTDLGQPVYATSKGRVVYAGRVPNVWGYVVLIAHKLLTGNVVYTQYAHLGEINVNISPGNSVARRQQIGTIGKMTGNQTCNPDGTGNCAHLHFEVRKTPVAVGNWPNNETTIMGQYYDPSDRARDYWTTASGLIESHRPGGCSATSITIGQTISGTLSTGDCRSTIRGSEYYADQYSFNGTKDQWIEIHLNSSAFDTFVHLIGPAGYAIKYAIAWDDDSGPGLNALLVYQLPSDGTYKIETTSFAALKTGNYTLLLRSATKPAAPTNLRSAAVSATQVSLIWRDNSTNEAEFRIERKTGASGTWSRINTVGAAVNNFLDTGRNPNTTYFYRVQAWNKMGCSGYSNEASVTTPGSNVILQDNMEAGRWQWYAQAPWNLTTATAHSPVYSWTDSPGGNYSNNVNVSLWSTFLNFTGFTSVTLTFWHRCDLESGYDLGSVWITTDNGVTYTRMVSFTGTNNTWTQATINLNSFAGRPSVRIVFQLFSDTSITRDGWYIDDVRVTGM